AKKRDAHYNELHNRVREALSGTGPLWFICTTTDAEITFSSLDRSALANLWPDWVIPLPLVRHLFATYAIDFGFSGADIASQMGHVVDGQPFDDTDPESPREFVLRVAPSIEAYLNALGFVPIATIKRHAPPATLSPIDIGHMQQML